MRLLLPPLPCRARHFVPRRDPPLASRSVRRSALEIMDQQMDSGMTSADLPAPSLPPPTLPLPHLIAVLDELICGEFAWYKGLPLMKTVFRLDWLHASCICAKSALGAAMMATSRSVALVRQLVLRANIADDEDFAPSCFGLDLRDECPDIEIVRQLIAAEEALQRELMEGRGDTRNGTLYDAGVGFEAGIWSGARAGVGDSVVDGARNGTKIRARDVDEGDASRSAAMDAAAVGRLGGGAAGASASSDPSKATCRADSADAAPSAATPAASMASASSETALFEAVLCRLRLRRALFVIASQLTRPGTKAVDALQHTLTFALGQLDTVCASVGLGTSAGLECLDGRASTQLLGAAPQRKVELPTRVQALKMLGSLLAQLQAACAIVNVQSYDELWQWLLTMTRSDICGELGGEIGIVARSYVALAGISEERHALHLRAPLAPQLWAAIGELSALPPEIWRTIAQLKPCGERLHQLTQHQLSLMRLCCLNRGRERRKLRIFLQDWAPLQELCDALDSQLQGAGFLEHGVRPFGMWMLTITVGAMIRFLLLGFELHLYSPCEYHMIYWRLECFYKLRVHLYESVLQRATLQLAAAELNRARPAASISFKKKITPPKSPTGSAVTRRDALRAAAMRDICCGLEMLLTQLIRRKLLPAANLAFTSFTLRYEKRFSVFEQLTQPAPLPSECYESLVTQKLSRLSTEQLGHAAVGLFKKAKTKLEKAIHGSEVPPTPPQLAELSALARVAIGNSIFVLTVLSESIDPRGQRAHFDFGLHAHYPLVSIMPH